MAFYVGWILGAVLGHLIFKSADWWFTTTILVATIVAILYGVVNIYYESKYGRY